MAEQPAGSPRRDIWLIYLLAVLSTCSQGALELAMPLNLHRLGYSLPLVGTAIAALGFGQIVSRLPGGALYRLERARPLVFACLAVFGLTTVGLGFTGDWYQQTALAGVHGFAFGIVTTFMLAILIDIHPSSGSIATTMAWYTAAISAGYALGAPLGAQAIDHLGYAQAFWVAGAVGLAAAAGSWALTLRAAVPATQSQASEPRRGWAALAGLLSLPAGIWLATLAVFYSNFTNDLLGAFFPIYAVGLGIPVAFVGLLKSIAALSATGIRFAAAVLFRFVQPAAANHVSVVTMGAAVVAISLVTNQAWLLVIFGVVGVTRGLIRVTTATSVVEERSSPGVHTGFSSGVYNAGLDAGTMLAPPLGGALAAAIGIPATFRVAAVLLPATYYAFWLALRGRRAKVREAQTLPASSAE